jgi:hypothetical protein
MRALCLLFVLAFAGTDELSKDERKALAKELAQSYAKIIARHYPHYNGMELRIETDKAQAWANGRGTSISVVHDLFGRYEFSAGDLGKEISKWIEENEEKLAQAKVVRIGLEGRGGYYRRSSASWFVCEKINRKDWVWHPRF